MAGTMSQADLVADLKASLLDAAGPFKAADDADFVRHLTVAAQALNPKRPRTLASSIVLQADTAMYTAPADMWRYKSTTWGVSRPKPWEKSWPGRLPSVSDVDGVLWFSPAPTAQQIATLGAAFSFFYYARHAVGVDAADTTVSAADRGLLLLRAQGEAMRELAMRDSVRPVQAQSAFSGLPKTGTPGALARWFIEEFEARCAA